MILSKLIRLALVKKRKFIHFLATLIFLSCSLSVGGQTNTVNSIFKQNQKKSFHFKAHLTQRFGFDEFLHPEWREKYVGSHQLNGMIPSYKSVGYDETDWVEFVVRGVGKKQLKEVLFRQGDDSIPFEILSDTTLLINLPKKRSNYTLKAYLDEQVVAVLKVQVVKKRKELIIFVPIAGIPFKTKDIEKRLNTIYSAANIVFDLQVGPTFRSKVFESTTLFSTPNVDRTQYTGQMRLLRDMYFSTFPKATRKAKYVFIVEGFEDSLLTGFVALNKSFSFVKVSSDFDQFSGVVAKLFASSTLKDSWLEEGPLKGTTQNMMDSCDQTNLTHVQWELLRKRIGYYSFYDNEENFQTKNGTVAYYFWKEDAKGLIQFENGHFLDAVKRPYKQNFLSYRFKVKYFIFRPFYKIGEYYISIIDVIFTSFTILILWFIHRRIVKYWKRKKIRFVVFRRILFASFLLLIMYQIYENYWITNQILNYFKQISGPIVELNPLKYEAAKEELLVNDQLLHEEISTSCSEVLIKRKDSWYLKKRSNVLYFEIETGKNEAKFVSNSDSIHLNTLNFHKKANSHFVIVSFKSKDGTLVRQEIYDHFGQNVVSKFENIDPPKRILIFVNGYRPTSLGQTFEENFGDVQKKGFEYPNSKNFIYDFDRYDYWQPWREINLQFQKRLNPDVTYYADGHFSVSTSNYKSMINFSTISSSYPKRCVNPKNHTCHVIQEASFMDLILNRSKTISQLKMRPNKAGFKLRKTKGRIAGENLLQLLNEIPEYSRNDTLYIVAHSMGFAYSQGIVEKLRGKIQFGGYYIIAPENGKSGRVIDSEWNEMWQYGSNLTAKYPDAPCLQDGIAPQHRIPGLPKEKQVYIPKKLYRNKGYFDSHFIGYYTWILSLEKDEKGYVSKR